MRRSANRTMVLEWLVGGLLLGSASNAYSRDTLKSSPSEARAAPDVGGESGGGGSSGSYALPDKTDKNPESPPSSAPPSNKTKKPDPRYPKCKVTKAQHAELLGLYQMIRQNCAVVGFYTAVPCLMAMNQFEKSYANYCGHPSGETQITKKTLEQKDVERDTHDPEPAPVPTGVPPPEQSLQGKPRVPEDKAIADGFNLTTNPQDKFKRRHGNDITFGPKKDAEKYACSKSSGYEVGNHIQVYKKDRKTVIGAYFSCLTAVPGGGTRWRYKIDHGA